MAARTAAQNQTSDSETIARSHQVVRRNISTAPNLESAPTEMKTTIVTLELFHALDAQFQHLTGTLAASGRVPEQGRDPLDT